MSDINRAWVLDLLTALVTATIGYALVAFAGGPGWASIGVFWITYMLYPKNRQEALYRHSLAGVLEAGFVPGLGK